jgi:hypothetical protein
MIIMDVIPGMQPDAEEFLKLFFESDEYKVTTRYTKFWPDGSARVTTHHGAIVDPTPGQRTVDAMEVAECTGVYDDVKEHRVKCDRGPLDFVKRFLPVAENEADNEYDSENEAGAEEATKKRKLIPNHAEGDHCHVPVARYAIHLVSVLNRG